MATFSYSANPKKLSFGNRIAYVYDLANVQTTGSKLYTPFKKITTYNIDEVQLVSLEKKIKVKKSKNGGATLRAVSRTVKVA